VVEVARALDNDSCEEGDSDDDHHARQPCRRASSRVRFRMIVPQANPLSPGEVLGSTLPWGGDKEGDVGNNLGWGKEETTLTDGAMLSWKCRFFRCRPQLVLKTCIRVFPTRRPDTAVVSATSYDVGFFFFCVVCRVVT